jgi:Putative DNA-binding domain
MLFADLKSDGFAVLEKLVSERIEENFYLEFKQKANANTDDLHKDDRRALGEALSGFANATGGLLVIGVKTENRNGIDVATELVPISNIDRVADRYRSYINECISPYLAGIEVLTLKNATDDGLIAIQVPVGVNKPYMSMAPGHQKYFRRVGVGFVPMQHYEIEEMMRMKTAPSLKLALAFASAGSTSGRGQITLRFGVTNESRTLAKYPYIAVNNGNGGPPIATYGLDGNGRTLWPRLPQPSAGKTIFSGGSNDVVHPGQTLFVSCFHFITNGTEDFLDKWAIDKLGANGTLNLDFEYGCDEHPSEECTVSLTRQKILSLDAS